MITYLTKHQVIRLNQATVKEHGGNFMPPYNFLHEENLDYLLEAVMAEMFGVPLYPTITDKAALYCHNIICNHISDYDENICIDPHARAHAQIQNFCA